ncbi:MAG: energy transducer TonB [Bacteroidota bacterium]
MRQLLLLSLLCIFSVHTSFSQADALVHAEQMPYFAGCEEQEEGSLEKRHCSDRLLVNFIAEHLEYPAEARNSGIEGTVLVSFIIDEHGEVQDPGLLRDIGGGCGAAALDVIHLLPPWQPAVDNGSKVKVKLNLPIQFSLKDDYDELSGGYSISWGRLQSKEVNRKTLMDNLDARITVRDPYGNEVPVSELIFSYEKKKKYMERKSGGNITGDMAKVVRKAKRGGQFTITASVQKEGKFLFVNKAFDVID